MNITAMIGAAISVARPIVRPGSLHSPASTATYSNPLNAPTASLPKMLRLSSDSAGSVTANGWYSGSTPRAACTKGRPINTANAVMSARLPALCSHLLTPSPTTARAINPPITAQFTNVMNGLLLAIQCTPNA